MTSDTAKSALVLLAVVAAGAALYWMRGIFTPLALAAFLLLMIDGIARFLRRRFGVRERAALPLAVLLTVLGFLGTVWVFVDGAASFAARGALLTERLNAVIADVARLLGMEVAPTVWDMIRQLEPQRYAAGIAATLQTFASDAFFVLVYLGFLIASRAGFQRKAEALFPGPARLEEAEKVFERIRSGVEGYLWVQTVTGLMIAAVAWLCMVLVGLDNALFWTFVIFIVCYIPILGGAVASLAPPIFAVVQFDTYWQAVALFLALQTILFVVGNWIQPRMQGENQNIDPVVILLSLAFWGALWGLPGMFLSTPLTVMAIAVLAQFPASRWIAILLSGDGDPYPPEPPAAS